MKSKAETKNQSKEFERFEKLTKQLVSVPKDEIKKREQLEQKRKEKKA